MTYFTQQGAETSHSISSLSLGQSIAARILGRLDPAQAERIGSALRQAIADKRQQQVVSLDHGDSDQKLPQHSLPATPSLPTQKTLDALPNQQVEDSQD